MTEQRHLELEIELDAPPEKVWRAVSIDAFREQWLPNTDLADTEPVTTAPGTEIGYRMRDTEPPYQESIVTFQIEPGQDGGTILRIIHRPSVMRMAAPTPAAANDNPRLTMRAA